MVDCEVVAQADELVDDSGSCLDVESIAMTERRKVLMLEQKREHLMVLQTAGSKVHMSDLKKAT